MEEGNDMLITCIIALTALVGRGQDEQGSITLEQGLIAAGIAAIAITALALLRGTITGIFNSIPTG